MARGRHRIEFFAHERLQSVERAPDPNGSAKFDRVLSRLEPGR
ncbi:hypothetical protein [Natrinema halophilum]|nr:hypothetical protein [Natrinema halophilum]